MKYEITAADKAAWRIKISDIQQRLNQVRIEVDLNPGEGKNILSQLDYLYNEVRQMYGPIKADAYSIVKLLERVDKKNRIGANDSLRHKAGIEAAECFRIDDTTTVNLYELDEEMFRRKEDMESIMDRISQKNSTIITMNGLMKVEQSFTKGY